MEMQWQPVHWGWLEGGGTEQKGKRTHGNGHQCVDCRGAGGIMGLKGNIKNTIRITYILYKKEL